jgi:hypothetical protein
MEDACWADKTETIEMLSLKKKDMNTSIELG